MAAGFVLPANAQFLDKHDLVVSKLATFRAKDRQFVAALIEKGLVDPQTIRGWTALLPDRVRPVVTERILAWPDSISPPAG